MGNFPQFRKTALNVWAIVRRTHEGIAKVMWKKLRQNRGLIRGSTTTLSGTKPASPSRTKIQARRD